MVLFNYSSKEVTMKIVYYGPGLCGKTTNLKFIYDTLPSNSKSKMISLATNQDRTLFFDFLPLDLGTIRGMKVRLQLYTVPGQVYYNSTRKLVLKGADGVVFVADSQDFAYDANIESLDNLRANLIEQGIKPESVPVVMQYNKRDLPTALEVEKLKEALNKEDYPEFEVIATTGFNVIETLKSIARLVLQDTIDQHGLMPGDTVSVEEIDFGSKERKDARRTTMMDFDETPDSVWEDEEKEDDSAAIFDRQSSEEFLFEEVPEKETPQPQKPISSQEPLLSDETPDTGVPPDTSSKNEVVATPTVEEPGDDPIKFVDESSAPSAAPPEEAVLPAQEPPIVIEQAPVISRPETPPAPDTPAEPLTEETQQKTEAASTHTDTPLEQKPADLQAPFKQPADTAQTVERSKPSVPEELPEKRPVKEIPITVELTPEDLAGGEVKFIIHVKVKPS